MSNYDPGELLVLWDPTMEDAHLTYDELYRLRNGSATIEKRVSVGQAIFL